jgi:hypothetical protein
VTIASGDKLLRDPNKLLELRRDIHGKIEVGEMEAAGLVEACRIAGTPWLVIRGISDFGDSFKDDRFHTLASQTAATVMVDFLQYGLDLGEGSGTVLGSAGSRDSSSTTAFSEDLRALEANVFAQMERLPSDIVGLVATKLGLSSSAPGEVKRDVVRALVFTKTGKEVVLSLHAVDEGLKGDISRASDRRILKQLLWFLLPFATDFRPWVISGRSALASGKRFVDLPLGTFTMAEAVIAGIDNRPCRYERDTERGPVGGALVEMPAASMALSLDPTGQRLAEATVGRLAVEFFHLAPDATELRNYAKMRRDVDETLQYFEEAFGEERVPRWLLLDGEQVPSEKNAAVAVAVLGKELPHLRMMRKGDGVDGETNLAKHIGSYWRITI